ncbi:hypothetical protein [Desulfovibrio sp.]
MQAWMDRVPDETPLTAMSIPGTHNSCARLRGDNLFTGPFTQCQTLDLAGQYALGVRWVDIRVRPQGKDLRAAHKDVDQGVGLRDVLAVTVEFLRRNPSEAVVMQVSCEGAPADATFLQLFDAAWEGFETFLHPGSWFPTLGEARGRIVLARRFASGHPGVCLADWRNDTIFTMRPARSGGGEPHTIRVQDSYARHDRDNKWGLVQALLCEAAGSPADVMYINYLSANLFPTTPRGMAESLNERLVRLLRSPEWSARPVKPRLGALLMDFPECLGPDAGPVPAVAACNPGF